MLFSFGLCKENVALLLAVPWPLQLQTLLVWWRWCWWGRRAAAHSLSRSPGTALHLPSGNKAHVRALSVGDARVHKGLALLKPVTESLRLGGTSKVSQSNL